MNLAPPSGADLEGMGSALLEAAAAAAAGEVPIGAVVMADGQLLARAHLRVALLCRLLFLLAVPAQPLSRQSSSAAMAGSTA